MWTMKITPRFGDIDGLRHVNNCMLPVWFESAREPVFRLFHPDLDLENWQLIMAKISLDFTAQIRLGSDVEIRTFVRRIGRSSVVLYQEAWQDGILGCKGEAVMVHYDFKALKSIPVPEHITAVLRQNMVNEDNPNLRTRSGRLAK